MIKIVAWTVFTSPAWGALVFAWNVASAAGL